MTKASHKIQGESALTLGMGHGLAMGLRRAYLALHRSTNACLAECGITADQFVVLASLADHGPMTQTQLGEQTFSDSNTISAMLGRLVENGYVSRKKHNNDGRVRIVSLTRRGRTMLAKCSASTESLRQQLARQVESASSHDVIDCLNGMAESLEQAHPSTRGKAGLS